MNSKLNRRLQPEHRLTEPTDSDEDDDLEIDKREMEMWSDADIVVEDGRTRMILYIDTDVFEWFTGQDADYHRHINEVLRRYIEFRHEESNKRK